MIDPSHAQRLQENWRRVVDEVHSASMACNRDPAEIRIIGVSKYVDLDTTLALTQAGCRALGESRPQQLWRKSESELFPEDVRWHLIGHLQRNKIRRTLRCHPIIHSVDSKRLLDAIAEESSLQQAGPVSILLEVNISGDAEKTGLDPDEVRRMLGELPSRGVIVQGLMAMAGWGTDSSEARRQFAKTRELRDSLVRDCGINLPQLSMGMSGDFAEAIAEGATLVRIGSRLFEGIPRT